MSVRMRHTKGHTGNRRSHHALKSPRLSTCSNCNSYHLRHRVCDNCGNYKGNQVVDVMSQMEKKNNRLKAKAKALGKEVETKKEEKKAKTTKTTKAKAEKKETSSKKKATK